MNCDYCNERNGIRTVYHEIYGDRDRVVYESERFVVFPCMGQLREGHLLIVSKAHINAIGLLDADAVRELEGLIAEVGRFFKAVYRRELLCFEHGVLGDTGENGGCGIYHMHLHLLPMDQDEFSAVLNCVQGQEENVVHTIQALSDTCDPVARGKTYVFLAQVGDDAQTRESYIITRENNYFVSQYMRKVICDVLGKTEWDWRQIKTAEPEFLNTLEKSRAFFKTK